MANARSEATKAVCGGWKLGAVCATVEIPEAVLSEAARVARKHYDTAEAAEFCADAVDVVWDVAALPELDGWLPWDRVLELGFERNPSERPEILATVGVDPHIDDVHGFVLGCVLFNDGLSFRQGRQRHRTFAGECFVFDDRVSHEVKETASSTTYLCLVVPLKKRPGHTAA